MCPPARPSIKPINTIPFPAQPSPAKYWTSQLEDPILSMPIALDGRNRRGGMKDLPPFINVYMLCCIYSTAGIYAFHDNT